MDITLLSNKKRLLLLKCLQKPHSVNDLLKKCDLSQSALSQHLSKLKDGGFVVCERDGNNQIYKISDKKIISVINGILSLEN